MKKKGMLVIGIIALFIVMAFIPIGTSVKTDKQSSDWQPVGFASLFLEKGEIEANFIGIRYVPLVKAQYVFSFHGTVKEGAILKIYSGETLMYTLTGGDEVKAPFINAWYSPSKWIDFGEQTLTKLQGLPLGLQVLDK